jgi:cell division protein FtsQ
MKDFATRWRERLLPLLLGMLLAGGAGAATHVLVDREGGVAEVAISPVPQHLEVRRLQALVAKHVDARLARIDLELLRAEIEALDWVASAAVRRSWPDRLEIDLVEHEPRARLGDGRFLTAAGEVVALDGVPDAEALPRLDVAPAHAETALAAFETLREGLAGTRLTPEAIARDARGSWTLIDRRGAAFRLGKGAPEAHLERLRDAVVPALGARIARVAYVDMRYGNGFAVGWDDSAEGSE